MIEACASAVAQHIEADRSAGKSGRREVLQHMKVSKVALAVITAALLTGCAGVRAHKGAVIDPQLASAIQPGVDNKESVAKTLGRPSFTGQFNANDWYYVSRVSFDQAGNVVAVQKAGKELVANLNPSHRITPTLGRKRSFFDELFGNIGSVNSGGLPSSGPQGY
jgi:outer membrane protein assembly factor BamE (lipoprotein component of BamABCDE complex)